MNDLTVDTGKFDEIYERAIGGDSSEVLSSAALSDEAPTCVQEPIVMALSDVEPESITWLWPGFLALGKLHLVDGDPGLGKSTLTLDLAARISNGDTWPDGTPGEKGSVLLVNCEDSLGDTIKPRLIAAQADDTRVFAFTVVRTQGENGEIVERLPNLALDIQRLKTICLDRGVKLVIIDPLMAFLGGTDSLKDQAVRELLSPLARIAEETNAAFLLVRHLTKGGGANPVYRGGGSIGIVGAARVGFMVTKHPDDEERRVLSSTKNNLAPPPPSREFSLQDDGSGYARIVWGDECQFSATDLLMGESDPEARSALQDAEEFLKQRLANGPRLSKELKEEAHEEFDIADRTLARARKSLGVRAYDETRTTSNGRKVREFWMELPTG